MLACLSRRRSSVQIRSGTLVVVVGVVRKLAKRPSSNLGVCGFDSLLRYVTILRVGWASVSPTACKAAAFGCAGSIPARRTSLLIQPRLVRLAAGCETLNLVTWVQLPYESIDLSRVSQAHLGLISLDRRVRLPNPQLF